MVALGTTTRGWPLEQCGTPLTEAAGASRAGGLPSAAPRGTKERRALGAVREDAEASGLRRSGLGGMRSRLANTLASLQGKLGSLRVAITSLT